MEMDNINTPAEIIKRAADAGVIRTERAASKQIALAFLAGAFVAFASESSNVAAFNFLGDASTFGMGRLIASLFFGTALMLVIIAGGELFTGNALLVIPLAQKRITSAAMLKNWTLVYLGNLAGSLFIAAMVYLTGQFNGGGGLLGGMTIKIAYNKTALTFLSAFISGTLCNWLVCLAVWMSFAARDVSGKILSIFFVIALFIISGFEHCVANMYYIPAGILAKSNALWAELSGLSAEQLGSLNWASFAWRNLLPVTLGNIVGGSLFVCGFYLFGYGNKNRPPE